MDSMWLEVILNVKAEEMDALCATLIANGVPGLAVEEEEEFRAFLEENRQYWDYVDDELMEQMKGVSRVKFYVTDDADGKKQLAGYLQDIDLPYTTVPLREYDWAHSWQKYYRPLAVGEKLYIVPEWERDTAEIPAGVTRLLMNPGLTFGTGSHASTQLCLEGVEAHTKPNDLVLDLGCGSGILAIAALCLGARFATGVDIDPKAVDVAYENAALNGIGKDRCRFLAGNVLADQSLVNELAQEKADLVLANIVAKKGGGIMPLGGSTEQLGSHKGYGYGMLCEIFSSILSMGATSNYCMTGGKGQICHGFMAINPAYFGDPAAIKEHFSKYLQELRDAPKADGQERIYTHGEKEVAAVKRIMENGIPVNDNTMVEVLDLCNYLGMDFGAYFGDYRPPVKKDVFKGNY